MGIIAETSVLFVHRVAFQYLGARLAFLHTWLEVFICLVACVLVALSFVAGAEMQGFVLVKFVTIFVGRAILVSPRVYCYMTSSRGRTLEEWFGLLLALVLGVNILEASYTVYQSGYLGGLVVGIGLTIPILSLPKPSTFFINEDGFFFGATWLWIGAYTIWNLAFTIVQHPLEANVSFDGVLANAAGLTSDLLVASTVHPGKWVNARGISLMWTLTFNYMLSGQPLMTDVEPTMNLTDAQYFRIDLVASLIGGVLLVVNAAVNMFGAESTRLALVSAPRCAKYGLDNPYEQSKYIQLPPV